MNALKPWRRGVVLATAILQLLWPLGTMTVYAQETPTGGGPAVTVEDREKKQPLPDVTIEQLKDTGEHTIVYKVDANRDDPMSVSVFPWIDFGLSQAEVNNLTDEAAAAYTGRLTNAGFYKLSTEPDTAYEIDPLSLYDDSDQDTSSGPTTLATIDPNVVPTTPVATTPPVTERTPSCSGDDPDPLCATFQTKVEELRASLTSIGAFERRLVVGSSTGQALLLGEKCDPDKAVPAAQDVVVNGKCDRTPRVDARLIFMLDYLLRAKKDGGAGREYIEIASVAKFSDAPRQEGVTYIDGVSDKCVVDANADADDPKGLSSCIQIKAIDKMRITTRIRKYGVFGKTDKFRYKAPIPIKVAWQTDEGQQKVPLPAISTQELLGNYSIESILDLLGESDFMSDPDFQGRPLQSMSLGDITRFMGGRLLKQLLDGQNIANFNFGDAVSDFGVIALAGALNIDPDVLRGANSLEDIETAQGRSWVANQLGLDRPLAGATSSELFADVARQQLAKLLDIKPYVLEDYQASELIQRLGQGLIEKRLPVPERSFAKNTVDEVKAAVGGGRFGLIFPNPSKAEAEAQLAEIDERLSIPVGTTANFVRGGDVVSYKKAAGEAVWGSYFGRYSDNKAGGFAPELPAPYFRRIVTAADAQPVGDLTKAYTMTDPNDSRSLIANPVGMTENDTASFGTLSTRLGELHAQIGAVQSAVQAIIDGPLAGGNCNSLAYDANRPVATCHRNGGIFGGSNTEINLLDARQTALSRMPLDQLESAIDAAIAKTDSVLAETSWNGEYVVLPSVGSQYYLSITTALRELASGLRRSRDHISNYRAYGSNGDGSSQRVDQLMNLPAGTTFHLLNGGAEAQTALVAAGVRTAANYLPTTNDRSRFEMLAASANGGVAQQMVVTDRQKQFIGDVFLTASPNREFRRIGRRILINNVSQSAQAEDLKQSDFFSDITFYIDRYETITNALNTIEQESKKLEGLVTGLPTKYKDQVTKVKDGSHELFALFNGIDPSGSSFTQSAALGVVKDKRDKFYSLQDTANQFVTSLESEANGVTGTIRSSTNNILNASRAIEQAVMEIQEGRPVTVQSDIPQGMTIPDIDLADFKKGTEKNNRCTYSQRQISILTMLYGDLNGSFKTTDGDVQVNVTQNQLKKIFTTLGSAKLAELLGLPMESFLYFSQLEDNEKSADAFFVSVGRGLLLSQCQNPDSKTEAELKTSGLNYVIAHSLTTLATKLGVRLPSWVTADVIAELVMGKTDDVLLAIGGDRVENELSLPAGTVARLVRPVGVNSAARLEERQRAIIDIVLAKLDIELDLPAGFTLTSDPIIGMGLARIEGVLGFEHGRLQINKDAKPTQSGVNGDTAAWTIENAIEQIDFDAFKEGDSIAGDDAEIATRAQIIAGLGMTLPLGIAEKMQDLDHQRQYLNEVLASNDTGRKILARINYASRQKIILDALTVDNAALFRSGFSLTGLEFDPNDGPEADALWTDAVNRQDALGRRLKYLDARLQVPSGSTEKWLTGKMTTTEFAREAGGGAAEQLGTGAFIAFLDRMGAEGPWVDAIKNRQTDIRTGRNNLDLLKDIVLGRQAMNGQALAQLYQMMAQTMSFNLDKSANFEAGTVANMIANPAQADEIAFDQSIRIFAERALHFDITTTPNEGATQKRLAAAMIYGAAYNPETGRFEGVSFGGGQMNFDFNGTRALLSGVAEFTRISQEWVQNSQRIPQQEWRYFSVPVTMMFDAVYGQLRSLGAEMNYVQMAQAQSDYRQRLNAGVATAEDRERAMHALGSFNATYVSARGVDLPASNNTDNAIFGLSSLDQFITQNRPLSSIDTNVTADEQAALEQGVVHGDRSLAEEMAAPKPDYIPPNNTKTTPTQAEKDFAKGQLETIGNKHAKIRDAQAYWQNTFQRVTKAAAYAAADYGLDKILRLPKGIVKPGMTMTLFEGTVSQKVSLVVDLSINYLLANVSIPQDLRFLVNTESLHQSLAFFLNTEGRGDTLAAAFGPGGILTNIQQEILPHGIFGDITLPPGTFSAMVGYLYHGNVGDFKVNGTPIKGLGNLFNSKWLLEVGGGYIGKLIGVDKAVMLQSFRLTYDLFKAFSVWNSLSNQGLSKIATNIALDPNFVGNGPDAALNAAKQKLAQAHDMMVTAAIALGIYVVNLVFGEQMGKFETAIGLPPGTLMQGLSMILTAIFIGTGPMFFVGLGIFVLTTLLGFGFVRTVTRATADGYYPLVGQPGDETKPGQKGIPHAQYPSADITDNNGAIVASRLLGEFDPTNANQKKTAFKKAAQQKVKGVIMDTVNREQLTKYFTALGLIKSDTTSADIKDLLDMMRPNQIFFVNHLLDDNKRLYSDDQDIIRLNHAWFNATGAKNSSGYCNKNHPAGLCAAPDKSGLAIDYLEISY